MVRRRSWTVRASKWSELRTTDDGDVRGQKRIEGGADERNAPEEEREGGWWIQEGKTRKNDPRKERKGHHGGGGNSDRGRLFFDPRPRAMGQKATVT